MTTKQKKKTSTPTAIAVELERLANLTVAAYQLLANIEQRHGELSPGRLSISESEWSIILTAEIVETRSRHELFAVLSRQRLVRQLRGDLRDMGEREQIAAAVGKSREAEDSAAKKLGNIDLSSDVTAAQLQLLQSQLNGYREDRRSAERMLTSHNNCFAQLMRLAPDPIQRHVEHARETVAYGEEAMQLSQVTQEATDLEKLLDANNPYSLLHHIESNYANGLLRGLIARYCPADVQKKIEGGRQLDKKRFLESMADLRTTRLPQLQTERDRLQPIIEKANHKAEAPLRDWAFTENFPIEILTRGV